MAPPAAAVMAPQAPVYTPPQPTAAAPAMPMTPQPQMAPQTPAQPVAAPMPPATAMQAPPAVDTSAYAAPAPATPAAPAAPTASAGAPLPPQALAGTPTAKAEKAVAFARAQIGKPCVWGAKGPGSYDNAGLTQASWTAAGVPLPRTAAEQAQIGTAVDVTALQPGDLVFFFDGLNHTGVYTGNGMMIHAPGPGAFVREESIFHAGETALRGAIRPA
ncbi:C40 family peptidase [Streptomyces roseirectus]|uniref:C40 family peptidase n=2 Tax=Streptomyces roseirectus TaxID=2768066 RepID=A0A7H0ITJ2_9ACTN|nr:C40 family peptidase [Streptomyces roseirectus]